VYVVTDIYKHCKLDELRNANSMTDTWYKKLPKAFRYYLLETCFFVYNSEVNWNLLSVSITENRNCLKIVVEILHSDLQQNLAS